MSNSWLPDAIAAALKAAAQKHAVWLVGGAIRDRLLERPVVDFDFAVASGARQLARSVADHMGGAYFELDAERDTGRVLFPGDPTGWTLDFAGLRAEDIEGDLRHRDFTINALAIDPAGDRPILDPTGGLEDLKGGRLRLCYPQGLADDPIRALRAVRLSSQLTLQMEPELVRAIRLEGAQVESASVERIRDELFAILRLDRPDTPLRLAINLGLLQAALPAAGGSDLERGLSLVGRLTGLLSAIVDEFDPDTPGRFTMAVASLHLGRFRGRMAASLDAPITGGRSQRQLLLLSSLLAVGENTGMGPEERLVKVADRLHLGRAEVDFLRPLGRYLSSRDLEDLLPAAESRAQFRFRQAVGEADLAVVLYALAARLSHEAGPPPQDQWERAVETARAYLAARFEEPSRLFPEPLVRGDDLMAALSLEAGPEVGKLLERILEAQAAGEVATKEQALELARNWQQAH